jgi:hypothetical protein
MGQSRRLPRRGKVTFRLESASCCQIAVRSECRSRQLRAPATTLICDEIRPNTLSRWAGLSSDAQFVLSALNGGLGPEAEGLLLIQRLQSGHWRTRETRAICYPPVAESV